MKDGVWKPQYMDNCAVFLTLLISQTIGKKFIHLGEKTKYRKASEGQTRTYTIEFSVKNTIQRYIDAYKCICY